MLVGLLSGCGNSKTTVSISCAVEDETASFAVDEIKAACERNNIKVVDSKADYTIEFKNYDETLGEQSFNLSVNDKTVSIVGGDRVGVMYGGLELAEQININNGMKGLESTNQKPYTEIRGVSCRPPMDMRTPSYTNNGDSTRWNLENTWDLDYWKGLFDIMARMRYNLLSFATVNSLPNMVKVEGYENCALDDVYEYTGDYDDSYYGNCTNMWQDSQWDQKRLVKQMTIDEKISFWQEVMEAAHNRGISWQFSTMNLYTFSETRFSNYGITPDIDNAVTKDYLTKSYAKLLETYPYIDQIKTTCGENMNYAADRTDDVNQWYRDVYGNACAQVLSKDPERAKRFSLGFAGVGNTLLTDDFYSKWTDYQYNLFVNKRYNDTRLLSVNKCTDNLNYASSMPDGWNMIYNVRGEDCYHLTWADADWVREWCKNVVTDRVAGWHFAIDGYYVSGKEYEFKDESLNGDYYYNRHWIQYSMFGRFAYDITMTNERWQKIVEDHYEDDGVKAETVDKVYDAMKKASPIMPNIISSYAPGGTDAAFLPEMCWSNPTLFGFLDIKRFVNSDLADPDGDKLSIAEYAKALANGETKFDKKTPFEVADLLRQEAEETLNAVAAVEGEVSSNKALTNILLDQKCMAYLGEYYAQKFEGAMNLRLYNDTGEKTYQEKAVAALQKGLEVWKQYASLYSSRFVVERLPRHGVIDPNSCTETVEKDISIVQKWVKKNY